MKVFHGERRCWYFVEFGDFLQSFDSFVVTTFTDEKFR